MTEKTLQPVGLADNLTITDEFEILEFLFNKYRLQTVSDYSRDSGVSRPSVYDRIEKGQVMNIELGGIKFIAN